MEMDRMESEAVGMDEARQIDIALSTVISHPAGKVG